MAKSAPKRGRPYKDAEPGTRASLGLRITAETKKLIEQAAEKSGRSQSQEAEFRLEQSFRDDRIESRLDEILHHLKEWK